MGSTKVPHDEQILVVEDHYTPAPVSETSEFHPDLILLDLRLPDMNGAEMVKELQKNQTEVPPVIILSADSPKSLKMAASSVGATAIRKPFEFDNLFQEIESALDKRRESDD